MALFHTVSPGKATGKVKEVYEDIKETKGIDFIPNFWQALSNNPDHKEPDLLRRSRVQRLHDIFVDTDCYPVAIKD